MFGRFASAEGLVGEPVPPPVPVEVGVGESPACSAVFVQEASAAPPPDGPLDRGELLGQFTGS